ncbi:MAG: exodeoxyribonuclease VII large subunit, partial [Planctomycetota bacterium]
MDGVLSVSEITWEIKSLIEDSFHGVHVRGEITNWRPASSGHVYFALTDADAKLPAVMWRSSAARLKFQPENGLQVIASGKVDVYAPRGAYQMIVTSLEPAGAGAAALALEQLKEKLRKEGLLDPLRKRPLPPLPRRIGIVTSPTGQAIRDLLRNLLRRFPRCWVTLRPAKVQGEGAGDDVAQGIRDLDELGNVDLVIVGRGGGSAEDLAAFNDEGLARAIAGCSAPVISAVGHEGDVSIADLVADLRVSTPTAAAEEAVPVLRTLEEDLRSVRGRLVEALRGRVDLGRERVRSLENRHALR